MTKHDDDGQATVFVAMTALALLVVTALLVAALGGVANDRARARTAADGAALAGAVAGRDAADEVAHRNEGVIEQYDTDGIRTTVRVRVGRARATASAARTGQGAAEAPAPSAQPPPPPSP
jgi:hypothetical protein